MNKGIIFILLLVSLTACTPLNISEGPEHRPDDREGEVTVDVPTGQVLEGLSWLDMLKNCKPDVNVPGSITGIVTDAVGLGEYYVPGMGRACVEKKLSDSHHKICAAREKLERQRNKARDPANKARIENAIRKLDRIQFKFSQKLYDLALKLDDHLEESRKHQKKTILGRAFKFIKEDELESMRDTLDIESYNTCTPYIDDNEEV